jgi:transcriptional regulator with GAF, ATPase, and Fis domain
MGRRPQIPVAPGQLVRVLEVLRQAEHLIERLAEQVVQERSVVRLPRDGYPLELIERDALVQALEISGWVQCRAAALLGLSPRVMNYKVQHYALRPPRTAKVNSWKVA